MYVGHLAIGLAIKEANPKVPAWPIIIGVSLIDIIGGIFLLVGWDHVSPDLLATPYMFFDLNFMDWDHSLLMALFWSVLWGCLFLIVDKKLAWLAGIAVFSHWLADWPVHNHDLALYPHSDMHFGASLWHKWGTWAWIAEGIFSLLLLWFAWIRSVRRGVSFWGPAAVLIAMFVFVSPFISPMWWAANEPAPHAQTILGIELIVGYLLPAWLVIRHYRLSSRSEYR